MDLPVLPLRHRRLQDSRDMDHQVLPLHHRRLQSHLEDHALSLFHLPLSITTIIPLRQLHLPVIRNLWPSVEKPNLTSGILTPLMVRIGESGNLSSQNVL